MLENHVSFAVIVLLKFVAYRSSTCMLGSQTLHNHLLLLDRAPSPCGNVTSKFTRLKHTIRRYHHILQDSDRLWQAFTSSVDRETYAIRYALLYFSKQVILLVTFAAKLKGGRLALYMYWSPPTYSPAVWLDNDLNQSCETPCKKSNVIYLLQCKRCGLLYVGETGQPLHSFLLTATVSTSHIVE